MFHLNKQYIHVVYDEFFREVEVVTPSRPSPLWTVSSFTPLNFSWDSLMTFSPPTTSLQEYFTVMHPIYHLFSPPPKKKKLIVRIPTILLSKQEVVKCDKSQIQSCNASLHEWSVMPPISRYENHNLRVIPIAALPVADWCHLSFCSSRLPWGFMNHKKKVLWPAEAKIFQFPKKLRNSLGKNFSQFSTLIFIYKFSSFCYLSVLTLQM